MSVPRTTITRTRGADWEIEFTTEDGLDLPGTSYRFVAASTLGGGGAAPIDVAVTRESEGVYLAEVPGATSDVSVTGRYAEWWWELRCIDSGGRDVVGAGPLIVTNRVEPWS